MDCLPTTPLQRKTLRKTSTGRNLTQKWQLKNQLHQCVQTLFSSGLYRRRRNFTCSAMAKPLFIGCTIGVELHHAPKILFCCGLHYTTQTGTLQGFCSCFGKTKQIFLNCAQRFAIKTLAWTVAFEKSLKTAKNKFPSFAKMPRGDVCQAPKVFLIKKKNAPKFGCILSSQISNLVGRIPKQ